MKLLKLFGKKPKQPFIPKQQANSATTATSNRGMARQTFEIKQKVNSTMTSKSSGGTSWQQPPRPKE